MAITGYIGNTDYDWYSFLSAHPEFREINFWQPSGNREFHAISPGEPFFFRLKAPKNAIAGFGYLSRSEILPAWLAWDTFAMANGAANFKEMISRVARYRRTAEDAQGNYNIGCLMIVNPVFFPKNSWVKEPEGWHPNIVQGRTIDLSGGEGQRIYTECLGQAKGGIGDGLFADGLSVERFGNPMTVFPRLGQGSFRLAVMKAYESACAITMEHSLPALEAAHVKPYADGGEHRISNGMLLRSDIHKLFDQGYVTVTPELKFKVSRKLKEDYSNGRSYYGLHGQKIHVPQRAVDQPDKGLLGWHSKIRFRG